MKLLYILLWNQEASNKNYPQVPKLQLAIVAKNKKHMLDFFGFIAIGPFFTDLSFAFVPFHTTKTREAEKTSDTDQVWSSFSYPSALYLFGGAYEFGPPRAKNTSLAPVCRE